MNQIMIYLHMDHSISCNVLSSILNLSQLELWLHLLCPFWANDLALLLVFLDVPFKVPKVYLLLLAVSFWTQLLWFTVASLYWCLQSSQVRGLWSCKEHINEGLVERLFCQNVHSKRGLQHRCLQCICLVRDRYAFPWVQSPFSTLLGVNSLPSLPEPLLFI